MMCPTCGNYDGTTTSQRKPTESTPSLEEQLRISGAQFDQIERENARVVTQLKEVIKMNNHWQRYDSQREEYVLKLTRTNQELQDNVSDLQRQLDDVSLSGRTETQKGKPKLRETFLPKTRDNDHGNTSDDNAHRELSATPPSSCSPFSSLDKEEEIAALTDHISKLQDKILVLERGRTSRKKADDDELAMLREQVNVCIEDFKQERKDRERIHAENQRLRERLAQSEQSIMKNEEQMYVYQEQIKRLQERCQLRQVPKPVAMMKPFDEPCCYPEDRPYQQNKSPFANRKTFRHPMHLGDDLTDLPSDVEVDGIPDEPQDVPDGGVTPSLGADVMTLEGAKTGPVKEDERQRVEDDEPLQCPRCLASFSIDRHADLLDHINTCLG